MKDSERPMRIGILGGGLSGLSTAFCLEQRGGKRLRAEVLEKDSECGGLLRSFSEEGFTFDYGGAHIIYSRDQEAIDFMLGILGKNHFRKRRNNKIHFKNSFVKYPFENGLSDLPKQDRYECLYHYLSDTCRSKPKNFKEWIYHTFGRGIAEKYLIPYNEKIWNYPTGRMSLHWVEGRVPRPPVEDVIKSALGIPTEGYTHQLYFHYPKRGGIQALTRGIEDRLSGVIRNFEVKRVVREDGQWTVSDVKNTRKYDVLISTIPIFCLVSALRAVPPAVSAALKGLKHNSLITVMLGLKGDRLPPFTAVYFPDPEIKFNRIAFPRVFSGHNAPKGKSSLVAEITARKGDAVCGMGDEEIAQEVIGDLHRMKLIDRRSVCFTHVRRSEYAYVIYDRDYLKNIRLIRGFAGKLNIHLCGRFSEFEYLNMDACVKRGMNLAETINEKLKGNVKNAGHYE
jgi:protoporphyrinogen oxidase